MFPCRHQRFCYTCRWVARCFLQMVPYMQDRFFTTFSTGRFFSHTRQPPAPHPPPRPLTPSRRPAQDKAVHKLKEVLTTEGMRQAGFPTKVSLPLYLGVYAAITFDNCKVFKPGELQPELFVVDPQYSSSRRMRKVCICCAVLGKYI